MRTPRLARDRQQWMFDYLVEETGGGGPNGTQGEGQDALHWRVR